MTRAHTELSAIVLDEQPLGAVLLQIAVLATRTIPGADQASITMIQKTRIHSVAFSGQLAPALDERQYPHPIGPCLDVARTGKAITINTAHSHRYPDLAALAQRDGIHHILSISLPGRHDVAGALNIYGYTAAAFDHTTIEATHTFAAHAAGIALNATLYAIALTEATQLRQALTSRASIDQAKGILMRDLSCTPDEAFAVLTAAASRNHRKLRDIAQNLITNTHDQLPAGH